MSSKGMGMCKILTGKQNIFPYFEEILITWKNTLLYHRKDKEQLLSKFLCLWTSCCMKTNLTEEWFSPVTVPRSCWIEVLPGSTLECFAIMACWQRQLTWWKELSPRLVGVWWEQSHSKSKMNNFQRTEKGNMLFILLILYRSWPSGH